MVSVSRLWHHCIYAVGCGCFLKVCQRYKRALALVPAVSLPSKFNTYSCWCSLFRRCGLWPMSQRAMPAQHSNLYSFKVAESNCTMTEIKVLKTHLLWHTTHALYIIVLHKMVFTPSVLCKYEPHNIYTVFLTKGHPTIVYVLNYTCP